MTTQQLIDLARVLVWPVALVVLAIVFRQPLSRLLVTITQLRFRDLEIDFGRELEKLRAKLPPGASENAEVPVEDAQALDPAPLGLAAEAASAQPLAGVLLAWTALEGRVEARASAGRAAELPLELRDLIQGLSDLSSAAAGGKLRGSTLSHDQAQAYIRLVDRATAWLDATS